MIVQCYDGPENIKGKKYSWPLGALLVNDWRFQVNTLDIAYYRATGLGLYRGYVYHVVKLWGAGGYCGVLEKVTN